MTTNRPNAGSAPRDAESVAPNPWHEANRRSWDVVSPYWQAGIDDQGKWRRCHLEPNLALLPDELETLGYLVVQWPIPALLKWLIILLGSFAIIMILYEFLVRRFNVLRFLFGMKLLPKPAAARPREVVPGGNTRGLPSA